MKDTFTVRYYDSNTKKWMDYITQKYCPEKKAYITIKKHYNTNLI